MNVNPDFSPSIKLMKPYFLLSSFFYFISFIVLFFIPFDADLDDFKLIGWVHIYMLGFIMLSIFSAMSQLAPVVVETKHYNVNIFKYLYKFLLSGLILLIFGFFYNATFLIYGGFLVLVAMSIYAVELLLTLKNTRRKTSITKAMWMSNIFLLIGIISGIIMSCGFSGCLDINPHSVLKAHTFGLLVGFILLLIMGISIILIPMFGSSKRISDNEFTKSFYTLAFAVVLMLLSSVFSSVSLEYLSYFLTIVSILLYFYQLFSMVKSRKIIEHDIWAKYMYVGFVSFFVSFLLLFSYIFNNNEDILKLGMWILIVGFFSFLIIGNLYKIIPFLVWFHIYSPLVETQSVPMLQDLTPKRLANLQWFLNTTALILSSISLTLNNQQLFFGSLLIFSISAFIWLLIINKFLK
ncbi:hypothetical protein FJR48_10335 [Sulfurimonas lithotrophica]|uniref:NnrS family protein n=1 Tax=Sulfurimonas lithotrophica TaxID=2590022 RepID=A0A5P8P3B2_9BACT|nr:hypothetical protein [Sulfurimonas lithotrophica]QFR50101.1 hypothetical protein FJR48_10335 [Sulfurimonas lithotrophica]